MSDKRWLHRLALGCCCHIVRCYGIVVFCCLVRVVLWWCVPGCGCFHRVRLYKSFALEPGLNGSPHACAFFQNRENASNIAEIQPNWWAYDGLQRQNNKNQIVLQTNLICQQSVKLTNFPVPPLPNGELSRFQVLNDKSAGIKIYICQAMRNHKCEAIRCKFCALWRAASSRLILRLRNVTRSSPSFALILAGAIIWRLNRSFAF